MAIEQNWQVIHRQDATIKKLRIKNKKLKVAYADIHTSFIKSVDEIKHLNGLLERVEESLKN